MAGRAEFDRPAPADIDPIGRGRELRQGVKQIKSNQIKWSQLIGDKQ